MSAKKTRKAVYDLEAQKSGSIKTKRIEKREEG